jgi:hypothetical protein
MYYCSYLVLVQDSKAIKKIPDKVRTDPKTMKMNGIKVLNGSEGRKSAK